VWLTDGEWARLRHELQRKALSPTEWLREALSASERERILRGTEFLRIEVAEEPCRLAEEVLSKEAEGWLFAAERLSIRRPQDRLERQDLARRARPYLEAAAYFSGIIQRFERQRSVIPSRLSRGRSPRLEEHPGRHPSPPSVPPTPANRP